jgi:hypothetical protein
MGVVHALPQMPADAIRDHRDTVLAAALAALREVPRKAATNAHSP